jgi:hypothetical protein
LLDCNNESQLLAALAASDRWKTRETRAAVLSEHQPRNLN